MAPLCFKTSLCIDLPRFPLIKLRRSETGQPEIGCIYAVICMGFIYFIRVKGAHGSPICNWPFAIILSRSFLIVSMLGRAGDEISPPGSLERLGLIRGALTFFSNLVVSNPRFVAYSFTIWPALRFVMPCHLDDILLNAL